MNARRLFFILILPVLMLSACAPAATPVPAPTYNGSKYSPPAAATVAPAAPPSTAPDGTAAIQRMVIMNASLEIVVDSPSEVVQTISGMAQEMGGFVVSSNSFVTQARSGAPISQAKISLRVPAPKLNDTLAKIRSLVKNVDQDIHNETLSGEDVTESYTDLGSQLVNLRAAERQLQAILEKATKTEDVLTVFRELTNTRQQIEVIQGKMKYYEQSAALSSIDVSILATASIAPIEIAGWQPLGIARDAVQTLIEIGKFLVAAVIWIVIVFLPLGVAVYIPVRLVRRMRKAQKPAAPKPGPVV